MSRGIDHAISFFALRAFNFLYDTVDLAWTGAKQTTKDMMAYLGGRHNIWHFLEGSVGPLPDSAVSSESPAAPVWSYRMDTNCLRHKDSGAWFDLFWLSASILVGGREYFMDDMIRNFNYIARGDVRPTPRTIMNVWSIRSGIWFAERERPVMRIIDRDGELHEVEVFGQVDLDRWERILDNDETSSDDSSSDSMDVSSDEEETAAGAAVVDASGTVAVINSGSAIIATDSGEEADEEGDSDSGDSATSDSTPPASDSTPPAETAASDLCVVPSVLPDSTDSTTDS